MSMAILSILQLTGIAAAYFLVILLLPWLFLRKWLAGFGSLPVRFMIYVLAGHFYIINLVYLLQFLHISCRLTLFIGTFAPFLSTVFVKYRSSVYVYLEKQLVQLLHVLGGETGRKTLFLRIYKKLIRSFESISKKRRELMKTSGLEIFLVTGLLVLLLYMYGTNAVHVYGYGASDVVVHNYWINEMGHNHIFADGVYPFGMHCLLYYLHVLFRIPVYVLLRLFYVVQTVMIHLVLLAFLRSVCMTRYAPYIGIVIYIISDRLYQYTYIRYYATLPQEMGMIFILPAVYFLASFLQEQDFSSVFWFFGSSPKDPKCMPDGKKAWKKKKNITVSEFYLVLFAVSISLTLSVHFYDTMITGLFCIAIGAGFCFQVSRRKYFKGVMAAGIAGILLGILPMGIAFITGTPLQDSLPQSSLSDSNKEAGSAAFEIIMDRMNYYVTNDTATVYLIIGSIGALFALGILWIFLRRAEYGAVLVSVSIYMSLLAVFQASPEFGLTHVIEVPRYAEYLGYGLPVVLSLCADAMLFLLFRKPAVLNVCSFAVLAVSCFVTVRTGVRTPVCLSAYESNEAVTCLTNILYDNEDETWTICSTNDERQMIEEYPSGYHYEMIDFLREMQSSDQDTSITIPTSTVYFFIEKVPILYLDYINTEKAEETVSQDGAKRPVSNLEGIWPYIKEERWVMMSHMYYWAQAFQQLYPNEMEIYYESENFVCYRIKQNENSLYNFAIDYGYNGYDTSKKD